MNKLNKLYQLVLEALGNKIKDDYQIVMVNNKKEYEPKIDNKNLYLPTNDALNSLDTNRVYFHPACESIVSKETEVDKVLRTFITSTIYFHFKPIAGVLSIIANKPSNKTITGKMLDKLAPLKGLTKDGLNQVRDLIARISIKPEFEGVDTRIVSYTLLRGGKTENDEHVYYRCTPAFPFYNEISRVINQNTSRKDTDDVVFNDSHYRIRTLKVVQAIFEIAIPLVEDPSRGEAVSLNATAARMTAMLRCFANIAGEINNLVSKFRKNFDEIGMYGIDLSWVEGLDELPDIVNLIPPLDYNNYNTASSTPEPSQDQQYDLFSVMSNNTQQPQLFPTQTQYQQPQQNTQQQNGAPNPPPMKEGERYLGMSRLNNGLFEYRYQAGPLIRVVCLDVNGGVVNETFTNPTQGNGQYNGYPNFSGSPMTMMMPGLPSGAVPFSGGIMLPNGVVVPMLTPPGTGMSDPYQEPSAPSPSMTGNIGSQMDGVMSGNWS